MAIEYNLLIKGANNLEQRLKNVYVTKHWTINEEKANNNTIVIDSNDELGFMLYILLDYKTTIEAENREYNFTNSITFRLDKGCDPIKIKHNILLIVFELLNISSSEAILLFNGEIVVLMKNAKYGLRINNNDFWDHGVIDSLRNIDYTKHNFEVL